ncbi:DUF2769 domain-containing protein [Methanobacterium sp.]|uniref:DUF2769 domain-containing protein n=1 Tax=Methanobacterium sp. TaxID=2164 RepID=UPI003C708541
MIKCICNACPTYNECMQSGNLGVFYSIGDEIRCFENEQECKCQKYTASTDYDFGTAYHCKDGTADMQMQSRSR